jgi:hypothetical protein
MGIEVRTLLKRKRVLEAEHPYLEKITPTVEQVLRIIEGDLNPEHFTYSELRGYCDETGTLDPADESFGLDTCRLRIALQKLTRIGFIERKPGAKAAWSMSESAAREMRVPTEDFLLPEERDDA